MEENNTPLADLYYYEVFEEGSNYWTTCGCNHSGCGPNYPKVIRFDRGWIHDPNHYTQIHRSESWGPHFSRMALYGKWGDNPYTGPYSFHNSDRLRFHRIGGYFYRFQLDWPPNQRRYYNASHPGKGALVVGIRVRPGWRARYTNRCPFNWSQQTNYTDGGLGWTYRDQTTGSWLGGNNFSITQGNFTRDSNSERIHAYGSGCGGSEKNSDTIGGWPSYWGQRREGSSSRVMMTVDIYPCWLAPYVEKGGGPRQPCGSTIDSGASFSCTDSHPNISRVPGGNWGVDLMGVTSPTITFDMDGRSMADMQYENCKSVCLSSTNCPNMIGKYCDTWDRFLGNECSENLRSTGNQKYRGALDNVIENKLNSIVNWSRNLPSQSSGRQQIVGERGPDGGTNRAAGGSENMLDFCNREPNDTSMKGKCDKWYGDLCGSRPGAGTTPKPYCSCLYEMDYHIPGWAQIPGALDAPGCFVRDCHRGIGAATEAKAYQPSNAFDACGGCTQTVFISQAAFENLQTPLEGNSSINQNCRVEVGEQSPPTPIGDDTDSPQESPQESKSSFDVKKYAPFVLAGLGFVFVLFFFLLIIVRVRRRKARIARMKRLSIMMSTPN